MDPTLYNAAVEGNIAGGNFILADHIKKDEENGYQVTPLGNTVLHVAALFGHSHFVGEVLKISRGMLCHQNKKRETALHIAANKGHVEVVRELFSKAGDDKETLMRMEDENGDTALHKAVRSESVDTVILLVKEDPEFEFPANKAGETPLYLAAESGYVQCLSEILKSCKKPTFDGPCRRTPLHVAIIHRHTDCVRSLWQWNKSLCEETDKWGWNSLHYAVLQGLKEVVSDMLGWKKSLAYLLAGSENDWTTAIHIAATEGDENMIYELSRHCPDCWDMLNSSGQNVFHIAILNNQEKVVKRLLNNEKFHRLIDVPDNDGNTPLHLLAASWNHVPEELKEHRRAKKLLFNKENQSPLDIALARAETTKKEKLVNGLRDIGRSGCRDFKTKRKGALKPKDEMETSGKMQHREDDQQKAKEALIEYAYMMKVAQIHLVFATLLMTVTCAAGFTLPGGFDSNPGPNEGMAILIRKSVFRAFVVTDVIAFTCSAGAIFNYFIMAAGMDEPTDDCEGRMELIYKAYNFGVRLQRLSMASVVIAFVTGIYVTLAHLVGLAVIVCIIGCISFPMFFWVLSQLQLGSA